MNWKEINFLIVDMDNTLCDTFHSLSKQQWDHVEKKLEEKGWHRTYRQLKKNFGQVSFKQTLEESDMTDEQVAYAIKMYDDVDVTSLRLFDDAHAILDLGFPKVLITRGEPSLQRKKIRHLDIRKYFKECVIVDTFHTKEEAIKGILERYGLDPSKVLIIGDRLEEEIATGNLLGCKTVLVRRKGWPVANIPVKADITVKKLDTIARRLT